MNTKFIIERHGESLGNAKRIYLGHTDLDLSEKGKLQAKITAEHLKAEQIDAIYSSDLIRAHNTALPHAEIRKMSITDSPELREIYIGDWEGKPIKELTELHYEEFINGWHNNFGTFVCPNGEGVLAAAHRFKNKLLQIARENEGKTVLITSHAAIIRSFWCLISGTEPKVFASAFPFPTNASYSTAEFDGERLIPLEYSHDAHLKGST